MAVDNNVLESFIGAIKQDTPTRNTTYQATVARTDDEGVVWVYVAGSDKETPTASSSAEVKMGDVVTVEWRNNKLYILGNYSNPSAGVTRVSNVEREASKANAAANIATEYATQAQTAAESAEQASNEAWQHADDANTAAQAAQSSADSAQVSANSALSSANNALMQLSIVEDVAGTLQWITDHGTFTQTTDTSVVSGKIYFEYNDGEYYPIAEPDSSANPSAEG